MGKEKRTQRRTEASILMEIRGTDEAGEEFQEFVTALEVSRRGASFLTPLNLAVLSELTVAIPGRGPTRAEEGPTDFFSSAAIVRVVPEGEMKRVSLRFIGSTLMTFVSEGT